MVKSGIENYYFKHISIFNIQFHGQGQYNLNLFWGFFIDQTARNPSPYFFLSAELFILLNGFIELSI